MGKSMPKGWKYVRLGDVCEINPRPDPLSNEDHVSFVAMADVSESGKLNSQTIIQATKERAAGYTRFRRGDILCAKITPCFENGKGALTNNLEVEQGIGSTEFHVIRPSGKIVADLVHSIVQSTQFRRHGELWMTGSAGQRRVPADYIENYLIELPPINEQRRITALKQKIDEFIVTNDRLLTKNLRVLDALRERTLIGKISGKRTSVGKVTAESVARNAGAFLRDRVMAVTKANGLRPMRAETIAGDISRYKLVRPNAFAYNPMRLNIGSIARSRSVNDVLVSPDYVVFECIEAQLLPAYLDHLRRTRAWASFFERAGDGGVRVRIYYDDFAQFKLRLPPVAEQHRVVQLLDAAQHQVELLGRKAGALELQKRGLMQKLLTGRWRLSRDLPGMENTHV